MQILQLSTSLPKNEYTTEELIEAFPCTLPEGVKQNVLNLGVSKRHLIDQPKTEGLMNEDGLVDLCHGACEKAVEKTGMSFKDIGCLIAAYDVNPFLSPGLSQLLVPALGLDSYAKLVNLQGIASTAFPKALDLAKNHLAMHPDDNVLLCISGVSSYWFQNQVRGLKDVMEIGEISSISDRARRELELGKWVATMQFFLFGDGVAAAIVTSENRGVTIGNIAEVTNIGRKDYLAGCSRLSALNEPFKFGFHSYLDREIPNLGVKYTGLALEKLLGEKAESTMKKAKKWAVHTGSEKILNALAEHNKVQPKKLKESHEVLKEYGNLAGASLPFILGKILSTSRFSEGDILLMLGYGWGFSASASLLEYA
jgi:predicted naringenin-chalcone synthase